MSVATIFLLIKIVHQLMQCHANPSIHRPALFGLIFFQLYEHSKQFEFIYPEEKNKLEILVL